MQVRGELGIRDTKEVARELGRRWSQLDASAKVPYELESRKTKEKYDEEMKTYQPSREFMDQKANLESKLAKKPKLEHPLAMMIKKNIGGKPPRAERAGASEVAAKPKDVPNNENDNQNESDVVKEEAMDYKQVQVQVGRRWEEEVGRSLEVEQARRDVELQGEEILRRKEQLRSARARGQELEARSRHVELALKPPALVFMEKVEAGPRGRKWRSS